MTTGYQLPKNLDKIWISDSLQGRDVCAVQYQSARLTVDILLIPTRISPIAITFLQSVWGRYNMRSDDNEQIDLPKKETWKQPAGELFSSLKLSHKHIRIMADSNIDMETATLIHRMKGISTHNQMSEAPFSPPPVSMLF